MVREFREELETGNAILPLYKVVTVDEQPTTVHSPTSPCHYSPLVVKTERIKTYYKEKGFSFALNQAIDL